MEDARVIEAELTWVGGEFRRGVRVLVGADGRIVEVRGGGARGGDDATKRPGEAGAAARVVRLAGRALLPGFVNAHSHAFQRALRGRTQHFPAGAGDFWSWREAMYAWVRDCSVETFREVCRRAFEEMRAAGFTTVGEFHYLHHADADRRDFALDDALIEAAEQAGIRLVLIGAYYAAGGIGRPLGEGQRRFATCGVDAFVAHLEGLAEGRHVGRQAGAGAPGCQPGAAGPHAAHGQPGAVGPHDSRGRLSSISESRGRLFPTANGSGIAIAAHSIRAVPADDLLRLREAARRRGWMFHMHIEEQPAEIEQCVAALGVTPMRWVLDHADVGPDFVVVHATHTQREALEAYLERGGRVCICPITEADLGDGIADVPAVNRRAAALSIGSDSNIRIDPTEELRWLEYVQRLRLGRRGVLRDERGAVARRLLEIGTTGGAAALGIAAGRIEPGRFADFAVVDLEHPALADVDEAGLPEAILFGAGRECIVGSIVGGAWDAPLCF